MITVSNELVEKIAKKVYDSVTGEPWAKVPFKIRQKYLDLAYDLSEIFWDNLDDLNDDEDLDDDLWEDYDDESDIL